MTPLDTAFAAMQTGKTGRDEDVSASNDTNRLGYYQQLADSELFVLLAEEATGAVISPALFKVEQGQFALAFDREERLSEFTGQVAPYAAMSGRVLVQMLAGRDIGLGVNLEVAPSSMLIPAKAVDWLNATLAHTPDRVEAHISRFSAPGDEKAGPSPGLVDALQAKLGPVGGPVGDLVGDLAGGQVPAAYLAGVTYDDGRQGQLLGFVGVVPLARDALAKAAGEALTFGGGEHSMDVGFFDRDDPAAVRLAAVGLKLVLPRPAARQTMRPAPVGKPGSDPDKPPILR